ncbi:MAG: TrmB family transcriptional regulator [Thermoplasmatota archaeon]
MTVNPVRLQKLQEHGLTEYEARAYLALLELGCAEASQIADLSRVPRTKIYQALDGLEAKRLLRVIPERPKRYAVEAFGGYLDDLAKSYNQRAAAVAESKAILATEFAPKGSVQLESSGGFLTLKGRSTIASKVCEMINRSERSLSVATSENGAHRVAYHADLLGGARDRGVTIGIHAPASADNREALDALAAVAEVRSAVVSLGAITLLFVDDREVLLVHHVPDDRHHFQGSDVALWSDDPGTVVALRAMLSLAWTSAPVYASGEARRVPVAAPLIASASV